MHNFEDHFVERKTRPRWWQRRGRSHSGLGVPGGRDQLLCAGDRRTAYHHPEGNSYLERFHRSLKEEEVWTAEYRSLEEGRTSIARWIEEYNHDRPHRGVQNRTPHEAFLSFAVDLKNQALTV